MNSVGLNNSSVQLFETQTPTERPSSALAYFEADESFKNFKVNAATGVFEPAPLDEESAEKIYSEIFEKDWSEVTLILEAGLAKSELMPLYSEFTRMMVHAETAQRSGDYSGFVDQLPKFQENVQALLAEGFEFDPDNMFLQIDEIREKLENILPGSTDGEPNDQSNILTWTLNGQAAEDAGLAGINVLNFDFSDLLENGDAEPALSVLTEAFISWYAAIDDVFSSIDKARDEKIELLSKPEGPVDSEVVSNVEKDTDVDQAREKAQLVQSELAKQAFSLVNATSPSALASFSL